MVRLQTLPVVDLRDAEGQELRSIVTRSKRFALLVYLAMANHGRFHRRDSLLPLFWPELDEARARRALNQALYVLRSGLGENVIVTRGHEEVGLSPEGFWCDAAAFGALLDEGRREDALRLYNGDFLPGFEVRGAPDFLDWLERERMRLHKRAFEAAESLAEEREAEGKTAAALSWSRRALELSPLHEQSLQRLVRILDQTGRQGEALTAYESFSADLESEFGLEPSPELKALIAQVREKWAAAGEDGAAGDGTPSSQPSLPSRPYKFLNHFEERDASIFFGRAKEAHTFLTKVQANRLNLLFGPSGSGKTSLLKAALAPRLRQERYVPVYVRIYDDPIEEIQRRVLEEAGGAAQGFEPGIPIEDFLQRVARRLDQPLVILLDQFEELFVRYDAVFRRHFAHSFHRCLAAGGGRIRFVVSLREEFLARLWEFREQIPNVLYNGFRLEPLAKETAREAIREPARLFGIELEEELVERLIQDLWVGRVEPPQLQIVCDTLYDLLLKGEATIRLSHYRKLGGAQEILGTYLERVLEALPEEEGRFTREVLKALVTSEETRTVARVEEVSLLVGEPIESVRPILRELSNRRLVRGAVHEEGRWYELTHEYLVEEIRGWLSEEEREVKELRALLDQALRNHRHLGLLMPPAHVKLLRANQAILKLGPEERAFLRASDRARAARRRKVNAGVAATLLLTLVAALGGRYWYLSGSRFIGVREWTTTHFRGDSRDRERETTISREHLALFAGRPTPGWIDGLLGFPRDLGELDFPLSWMDPEEWDGFRDGLRVSRKTDGESEALARMAVERRIARLAMTGRIPEALQEASPVYDDPPAALDEKLDTLSWLLGWSGVSDPAFVEAAVRHGLRHTGATLRPWFAAQNRTYAVLELLANLSPEGRASILGPYLGLPNQSGLNAQWLATMLRMPEARDAALALMASSDSASVGYGIMALVKWGDCEDLEFLSEAAFVHPNLIGHSTGQDLVQYFTQCRAYDEILTVFDRIVGQDFYVQRNVFRYLFALDPDRSLSLAPVLLEPTPPYSPNPIPEFNTLLDGAQGLPESDGVPLARWRLKHPDPEVRAGAAAMLAEWGHPDALGPILEAAFDEGLHAKIRSRAMRALRWFSGPAIVATVDSLLAAEQTGWRKAYLHSALASADPSTAVPRSLPGLADPRREVRRGARGALLSMPASEMIPLLEEAVPELDEDARIQVSHVIQTRTGSAYPEVFRSYLERERTEPVDEYRVQEAIRSLVEAYLLEPVSQVIDALGSPRRNVRAAAMLALAEHPDRDDARSWLTSVAADPSHSLRARAQMALWAFGLMEKAHRTLDLAYDAVARGQPMEADAYHYRANDPTSSPLSPRVAFQVFLLGWAEIEPPRFEERERELYFSRQFQEGLTLPPGSRASSSPVFPTPLDTLAVYLESHPNRIDPILQNPLFDHLKEFYAFRVLTGLQEPLRIEAFPEGPSGDGTR